MVKIRLMRIGAKKRPFYRVVAVNEQAKRTGGYLELLGTYNPLTSPKEINLKQDRIDHWIKQGAQMTNGFLRIIGKAKQRLPQKPKKQKKEEAPQTVIPSGTRNLPSSEDPSLTVQDDKSNKGNTPEESSPGGGPPSEVSKEKQNEGSA